MNALIDVTGVRLETERLILRPWTSHDLDDFYEYASVPGVGEMVGWPAHQSRDESQNILQMFIDEKKTFAIELKSNHKVIGSLGIEEDSFKDNPQFQDLFGREIGYVLSQDYWGQGLMPEAVQRVVDYCFEELNYDYLTCGYFLHNTQSQKVGEKCGFQFYCEKEFQTRLGKTYPGNLIILKNNMT